MSMIATLERPKTVLRYRADCLDCVGPHRPLIARDELSAQLFRERHESATGHEVSLDMVLVELESNY